MSYNKHHLQRNSGRLLCVKSNANNYYWGTALIFSAMIFGLLSFITLETEARAEKVLNQDRTLSDVETLAGDKDLIRVSCKTGSLRSQAAVPSSQGPAHTEPGAVWEWRNPLPTGNHLQSVAASDSSFVAVGSYGTVVTSPDGVAWTRQDSGLSLDLRGVAWNGIMYVSVGDGGTIITSPDGEVWT